MECQDSNYGEKKKNCCITSCILTDLTTAKICHWLSLKCLEKEEETEEEDKSNTPSNSQRIYRFHSYSDSYSIDHNCLQLKLRNMMNGCV